MRKFIKLALLVHFLFFQCEVGFSQDENYRAPFLTIERAIEAALIYTENNDIDLQRKFIKKVEYHDGHNHLPFWRIYWINEYITKGGDVELKLYADGTVEKKFYK